MPSKTGVGFQSFRINYRKHDEFKPTLYMTPYTYAKLVYLRDVGETEVGGFFISSPDSPFFLTDFILAPQEADWAHVELKDHAFATLQDKLFEEGFNHTNFVGLNVHGHTHPGNSADPSHDDEKNFEENMADSSWAVMFIIAKGGETYCRLKYTNPIDKKQYHVRMNVQVDWTAEFEGSDVDAWLSEYSENVEPIKRVYNSKTKTKGLAWREDLPADKVYDYDAYPGYTVPSAVKQPLAERVKGKLTDEEKKQDSALDEILETFCVVSVRDLDEDDLDRINDMYGLDKKDLEEMESAYYGRFADGWSTE